MKPSIPSIFLGFKQRAQNTILVYYLLYAYIWHVLQHPPPALIRKTHLDFCFCLKLYFDFLDFRLCLSRAGEGLAAHPCGLSTLP